MKTVDDKVLIRAIADRDAGALAELFDRYAGLLQSLSHKILDDFGDAEEILQETFLQVWNQAGRYDPGKSSVSTWLVLIARSRSIDRLRSRRVKLRTAKAAHRESPVTHTSPVGTRNVLLQERRKRLSEAMAGLPAEQREVLELAFYGGLTQSDIAERTKTPLGTVKTRTLLAMKKLRIALQDDIEELL